MPPADLPRLLERTGRAVARARRTDDPDLSPTARAVLALADTHGPCAHRDLAVALGVAPATVTAVVDGLERRGLVARARDEHDRRVVRVALTAAGRARLATTPAPARPLPHPPPAEAEVVRRYLVAVLAALEDGGGPDGSGWAGPVDTGQTQSQENRPSRRSGERKPYPLPPPRFRA